MSLTPLDSTLFDVFFIGGPWNNRLVRLSKKTATFDFLAISFFGENVVYSQDRPLPTGIRVFSCLDFSKDKKVFIDQAKIIESGKPGDLKIRPK